MERRKNCWIRWRSLRWTNWNCGGAVVGVGGLTSLLKEKIKIIKKTSNGVTHSWGRIIGLITRIIDCRTLQEKEHPKIKAQERQKANQYLNRWWRALRRR